MSSIKELLSFQCIHLYFVLVSISFVVISGRFNAHIPANPNLQFGFEHFSPFFFPQSPGEFVKKLCSSVFESRSRDMLVVIWNFNCWNIPASYGHSSLSDTLVFGLFVMSFLVEGGARFENKIKIKSVSTCLRHTYVHWEL